MKENNRPKSSGSIISSFIQLEYNNRNWLLKVFRLVLQQQIYINQEKNTYSIDIVGYNKLRILPSSMVRIWRKDIRTVLQTSFSLYLHNQQTDFHKLSCTGKSNEKYRDWIQNLVLSVKYINVDFINNLSLSYHISGYLYQTTDNTYSSLHSYSLTSSSMNHPLSISPQIFLLVSCQTPQTSISNIQGLLTYIV